MIIDGLPQPKRKFLLIATEETKKIVFCRQPKLLYDQIPEAVRKAVILNHEIPMETILDQVTVHLSWFIRALPTQQA